MEKISKTRGLPPTKILELISQIKGFQTPRLANELWALGEDVLKKEKLWPKFYNLKFDSSRNYYSKGNLYSVNYTKENSVFDEMSFININMKDDIEAVYLKRSVDIEEREDYFNFFEKPRKMIYSILVVDNERRFRKNFVYILQS